MSEGARHTICTKCSIKLLLRTRVCYVSLNSFALAFSMSALFLD